MTRDLFTMHAKLREHIESFTIDEPGVPFAFSDRLARENGWSRGYTRRVIEEYKRFLFLAMAAGHPVTPSVDVDQAWHLHLTYTRSYWDRLCGEVLRSPLHHNPTVGGRAEGEKFNDWYSRTLMSYELAFGAPPPDDIWPPTHIRMSRESIIRQVSDRTHWVIRKPRRSHPTSTILSILLAVALTLAGCAIEEELDLSAIIAIITAGWGVAMIVVYIRGSEARARRRAERAVNAAQSRRSGTRSKRRARTGAAGGGGGVGVVDGGYYPHEGDDGGEGDGGYDGGGDGGYDGGGDGGSSGGGGSDSGGSGCSSSGCGSSGCGGGGCGGGGCGGCGS